MGFTVFSTRLLAFALPLQPIAAQATHTTTYGGGATSPVAQTPPVDPKDTPEEIAQDAARDLKDSRFYNKPGATRAQYDADWQTCRLIARGSRTPSGSVPFYYNPAIISPIAAGIGGGIGGLIGAAIAEGQQRRANRQACLLIKGWRLVEVPSEEAARVGTMTEGQKDTYFNAIVGAETVKGSIFERTSFSLAPDPALNLDAPVTGPGTVFLGKKVDAAAPFKLAPGEAAVVLAFRRPDAASAGRSGSVQMYRYDATQRDVMYKPRDWKKKGDLTNYAVSASSADKKAAYEVQVIRLTPGDYVLNATTVGPIVATSSNCFGAPTFRVNEGEIAYLGDFIPFMNAKLSTGDRASVLAWTPKIEDARKTLAVRHANLAEALKPAPLHNGATYGCSAIMMTRWDLPGVAMLPEPVVATTVATN